MPRKLFFPPLEPNVAYMNITCTKSPKRKLEKQNHNVLEGQKKQLYFVVTKMYCMFIKNSVKGIGYFIQKIPYDEKVNDVTKSLDAI